MKDFFRYIAGDVARWIRGIVGFTLIAIGYSYYEYPANLIFIVIGTLVMLAAIFNVSLLAPLCGYPLLGSKMKDEYGERNNMPGEDDTIVFKGYSARVGDDENVPGKEKTKHGDVYPARNKNDGAE